MYVKYTWLATSTEAQVRADLIALMCGQTDINALSASCDKPFSKIIANTSTTNWLIHDAAASATSQVLRSLNSDGTTYKYVQVILTGGVLTLKAWEGWNNTTHVGLNYAVGSTDTADRPSTDNVTISYTTPSSIYIFATPRYLITSFGPLQGGYGTYIFEISRDSNFLNETYPCHVSYRNSVGSPLGHASNNQTSSGWSICRYKNPTVSVGDYCSTTTMPQVITTVGQPLVYNGQTGYYTANSFTDSTSKIYGVDGAQYYPAYALTLGASTFYPAASPYWPLNSSWYYTSYLSGSGYALTLGKVQGGIYYLPQVGFSALRLDEMIYNNITYVLIPVTGGQGGWFIIPKA